MARETEGDVGLRNRDSVITTGTDTLGATIMIGTDNYRVAIC
jgi:hypothetical protein